MTFKMVLTALSILFLLILISISTIGCQPAKSPGDISNPASKLPLIDRESHPTLETAYFALG
jgi:hypothetical protein